MKAETLWQEYKKINPDIGEEIDAWAFGAESDKLADLVLKGEKTATASVYDLYQIDNEPIPEAGTFDVILDSKDNAICIVEITKVTIVPFNQVSEEHAFKEGEGDKTLSYWRKVHKDLFNQWFEEENLIFTEDKLVVLEEFCKVYPLT